MTEKICLNDRALISILSITVYEKGESPKALYFLPVAHPVALSKTG